MGLEPLKIADYQIFNLGIHNYLYKKSKNVPVFLNDIKFLKNIKMQIKNTNFVGMDSTAAVAFAPKTRQTKC